MIDILSAESINIGNYCNAFFKITKLIWNKTSNTPNEKL